MDRTSEKIFYHYWEKTKVKRAAILVLAAAVILLTSCNKEDAVTNSQNPPADSGNVVGTVRDANGALAGVAIHVIYDLSDQSGIHARRTHTTLDSAALASFTLIPGNQIVTVNWVTASESFLDHFDIRRNNNVVARVAATNSIVGHAYSFVDESVVNGTTYQYDLVAVNIDGSSTTLASDTTTPNFLDGPITDYALYQNYPNPVLDTTTIAFDLPSAGVVSLKVYNASGQEISTLIGSTLSAGKHSVDYAMNDHANGVYEYRLTAGDNYQARHTLLKNTSDNAALLGAPAADVTNASGAFGLNVVTGDTIALYDEQTRSLGEVVLHTVIIRALKSGYLPQDTILTLTEQSRDTVDFFLTPDH
jgi:hypothetical protein